MKQIAIPPSITKMEANCFDGCSSLEQISIHGFGIKNEDNAFKIFSSLKHIYFEDNSTISSIGHNAFDGCRFLEEVSIHSIEKIENETFQKCSSLKKIIIPSYVTLIGYGAFVGCLSLKEMFII